MDKLLIAILCYTFIFTPTEITLFTFLSMFFLKLITITHNTLFSLFAITTYYLYGLLGTFYIILCSFLVNACGIMFWYEMSVTDIKESIKELKTDEKYKEIDTNIFDSSFLEKRIVQAFNYKNQISEKLNNNVIYKNVKRLTILYYSTIITYFDKLSNLIYFYMCKFRLLTENIIGFKHIYRVYDKFCKIQYMIISLRSIHKMTRQIVDVNTTVPMGDMRMVENMMESMFKNNDFMNFMSSFDKSGDLDSILGNKIKTN